MIGAALLAREEAGRDAADGSSSARRRSGTSRTSRCACSPRCATRTSSRARTRGGRACCSSATASGDARPLPRAQRAGAHRRPGRADARRRGGRARVRRRHAAGLGPGLRARAAAASRRGSRWRCCRGRRRRWPRSWRRRCRRTPGASSASCRASGRAGRGLLGVGETLVAFESPKRVAASLAVLAELDPGAARSRCAAS